MKCLPKHVAVPREEAGYLERKSTKMGPFVGNSPLLHRCILQVKSTFRCLCVLRCSNTVEVSEICQMQKEMKTKMERCKYHRGEICADHRDMSHVA